ncbi:MAG TPA: glycosyltransferase family 2 protein [Caulobacteraceae bacterium]|nr:glycosyltransferase family 2 protein [Caulobacteraceae bacterium]
MSLISVIVPAHNEASVIQSGLKALTGGASPERLEVIVVCNGCTDQTAQLALAFAPIVQVIETDTPSKTHALNLGDQAARGFPRLYVDADVAMTFDDVLEVAAVLESGRAIAAAPAVETVFLDGTARSVRGYYDVWMSLPYVQKGMVAAGAYALSQKGRERFGEFPKVIADDGYIRLLFKHGERIEAPKAISRVLAPKTIADLIKIKTRSRLGVLELAMRFPELHEQDHSTKGHLPALLQLLAKPRLYHGLWAYFWVTAVSRIRAKQQARNLHAYVWERDHSSRIGAEPKAPAQT